MVLPRKPVISALAKVGAPLGKRKTDGPCQSLPRGRDRQVKYPGGPQKIPGDIAAKQMAPARWRSQGLGRFLRCGV